MHTVVGFGSAAFANSQTYGTLPSVADQAIPFNQSGQFILPANMKIIAGILRGTLITAARINMPWLRNVLLPELYPAGITAAIGSNPPFIYWRDNGFTLRATEGFTVEVSTGGAAAARCAAALWLQYGMTPAAAGPVYTMRCTVNGTIGLTTVANAWTFGNLTFTQTLPSGTYSVVGMQVSDTEATAARLVFPGYGFLRPGVFPQTTYGQTYSPQIFRHGYLGEWGRFTQTAVPGIELLGFAGAAETPNVFLDLIKVSDSLQSINPPVINAQYGMGA